MSCRCAVYSCYSFLQKHLLSDTDTLALSTLLSVTQQSIGVASKTSGFAGTGIDGILGLGPTILTSGSVSGLSTVPTVPDNLLAQHSVSSEVVSIFFAPTTVTSTTNGELSFGGVDASKYSGAITFAPITTTSPSKYYWGVSQSIAYGSTRTTVQSSTAGIIDAGTTLILLATNSYNTYRSLTGATLDSATGLLTISATRYASLQSLYFTIGGTVFELTKNAQTWPRPLNTAIGGRSTSIYLIIGNVRGERPLVCDCCSCDSV